MRLIDADELEPDTDYDDGEYFAYSKAQIDNAPTIKLECKTGKWLPDNNNYYEERYICSECKRSYKVDACMGKPIWNYCPNCGDKKEEPEDIPMEYFESGGK